MGRITVFSSDGCPHCWRVKNELNRLQIPFLEISITAHPEKREDMIKLANRFSTPQVFFNTRHVGGADETIQQLQEWEKKGSAKKRYQRDIEAHPDPVNPRFSLPDTTAADKNKDGALSSCADREKMVKLPNGTKSTVLDVVETLKKILPIRNLNYRMTVYRNCFTGAEAVKVFQEHYDASLKEAIEFGKHLQELEMLHHVKDDHVFSDTPDLYFRLHCHQTSTVLNTYRVWNEPSTLGPMQLCMCLRELLTQIEFAMTDENGLMDYENAHKCPLFPVFEEAVCELQKVDLKSMDDKMKTVSSNVLSG